MSTEDDIAVLVAARDDTTLSWEPATNLPRAAVAAVRRRRHRRTVLLVAAAVVVVAGAIAVPTAIRHSDNGGSADRVLTGPSPSTSAGIEPVVDFSAGYLPAGYRYFHTERPPHNVAADATRSYALHGNPQSGVLWVKAQYGLVSTLAQYRKYNGPLRDTTVSGHPAVIGWNTGRVGEGLHLLYVLVDAHTSIEVSERPAIRGTPLPDSQLEQVAAAVSVTTSGPATSTITIPDVLGLSQQAAVNALIAAGAGLPVVENRYGTAVERDHVISQSPAAGEQVPRGTSVTLKIAG